MALHQPNTRENYGTPPTPLSTPAGCVQSAQPYSMVRLMSCAHTHIKALSEKSRWRARTFIHAENESPLNSHLHQVVARSPHTSSIDEGWVGNFYLHCPPPLCWNNVRKTQPKWKKQFYMSRFQLKTTPIPSNRSQTEKDNKFKH